MSDPLVSAVDALRDFARAIADLDDRRAEIDRDITAALDIAAAHGFDRTAVRAAARVLRGDPDRPAPSTADLYAAAMRG